MASPVVINSSSPISLRLPSITPPGRRDGSKNATSSSPGLPSPSAFVKPKISVLKSGSRAQAIPPNAGFGFSTASSLWRGQELEAELWRGGPGQEEAGQSITVEAGKKQQHGKPAVEQKTASGKLRKPQKTARGQTSTTAQGSRSVTVETTGSVCDRASASPAKGSTKGKLRRPAPAPPRDEAPSRRPNLDISDYAFGVYDLDMQTQAPPSIAPANPRKRAGRPRKIKEDGAVSRPRKGKAKSEAVILNSDEPKEGHPVAKHAKTTAEHIDTNSEPKRIKKFAAKLKNNKTGENDLMIASKPKNRIVPKSGGPPTEKSAYFTGTAGACSTTGTGDGRAPDLALARITTAQPVASDYSASNRNLAAPRRTDWTPVKDTGCAPHACDGANGSQTAMRSPKLQLIDILGGFGYVDAYPKQPSVERAVTGEAVTKRRRIELADAAAAPTASRKAEAEDDPSGAKQTKKPASKKKLQTITALATAAYQPAVATHAEQSIVSEFLAPKKHAARASTDSAAATEKPKKPRKPRTKKAADVAGDGTAVGQSKKVKKTKVKFSEEDHKMDLYSPTRAEAQMKQQDFLFGTSSQLAVDESPAFIRDIQAAVQASEGHDCRPQAELLGSQIQSSAAVPSQANTTPRRGKSCAKVPTAPHGTCLSLEQAQRELWCASSRDHDGGFLRKLPRREDDPGGQFPAQLELYGVSGLFEKPLATLAMAYEIADGKEAMDGAGEIALEQPNAFAEIDESNGPYTETSNDRTSVVDLVGASALANADAQDSAIAFDDGHGPHTLQNDSSVPHGASGATTEAQERRQDESTWMSISSDEPEHAAHQLSPPQVRRASRGSLSSGAVDRPSLGKNRGVLQPLDVNAKMSAITTSKVLSSDQTRPISTIASDPIQQATAVRPRGRPRKNAASTDRAVSSPKKRGRPPTRPVIASDPSPEVAKFKKPKAAGPASQQPHSSPGWLDVDEISDSDSPVTPSPPRRRATSTPPAISPLDIAVDGSPLGKLKDKTSAVGNSTFKPSEPQWQAIRHQLFPKISATIKDITGSNASSAPSWYQKILMYDPVVLEDLTAWLNEQGLRIQLQKQKPKIKKRGRKKKGAEEEALALDAALEWETHEEHLQPWMVQKWCEERSICCVWAGGGWGGRASH